MAFLNQEISFQQKYLTRKIIFFKEHHRNWLRFVYLILFIRLFDTDIENPDFEPYLLSDSNNFTSYEWYGNNMWFWCRGRWYRVPVWWKLEISVSCSHRTKPSLQTFRQTHKRWLHFEGSNFLQVFLHLLCTMGKKALTTLIVNR